MGFFKQKAYSIVGYLENIFNWRVGGFEYINYSNSFKVPRNKFLNMNVESGFLFYFLNFPNVNFCYIFPIAIF